MVLKIKGNNIKLSQSPVRDISCGLLARCITKKASNPSYNIHIWDVLAGRLTYKLPDGITKKDVVGVYLRML